MSLASTSILMVEQAPPFGCCQYLCPQVVSQLIPSSPGGSARLASVSDSGSCQVTASVLGEHVRFDMHPLRAESLSYSLLAVLYTSPADLRSYMFWGLVFPVQNLCWGSLCVSVTPHSLGKSPATVVILSFVDSLPGDVGFDYTMSNFFSQMFDSLYFLLI